MGFTFTAHPSHLTTFLPIKNALVVLHIYFYCPARPAFKVLQIVTNPSYFFKQYGPDGFHLIEIFTFWIEGVVKCVIAFTGFIANFVSAIILMK
jgi:hypothetical protein